MAQYPFRGGDARIRRISSLPAARLRPPADAPDHTLLPSSTLSEARERPGGRDSAAGQIALDTSRDRSYTAALTVPGPPFHLPERTRSLPGMISRVGRVSSAMFALLAGASLCSAAEPAYGPRRGGIGGQIGGSQLVADADYSSARAASGEFGELDARPRFAFSANFRYVVNSWLRWQVSPGFFWAGYKHTSPLPFQDPNFPSDLTKEKLLTLVIPISAQVQVTRRRGDWLYHAGGGPGVYRVWVENRRKVLKDPTTKRLHQGFYPGASAQLGVERFLKTLPATAIEVSAAGHWAFADRPDQFPSGFNSALLGVELRVGGNYYFELTRFVKKKPESTLRVGK